MINRRRLLVALPVGVLLALFPLYLPAPAIASDSGDSDEQDNNDSSNDNDDDDNDDDDDDDDDHEEARQSVRSGQAISLADLLVLAAPYIDGEVINVRLIRRRSRLLYQLTVLGPSGNVSKLYFLAKNGRFIER